MKNFVKSLSSAHFKNYRDSNFKKQECLQYIFFREIYSHRKNISSNQLLSDFFCKCVAFTKFLQKNVKLQCFNYKHDNFSWNYFLVRVNFRSIFLSSWLIPHFVTYEGQYMFSTAPHKSYKMWNQSWAEKSGSEKLPILTKNCRL